MKPWPEPFDPSKQTLASYLGNVAELNYEHARAEAAIERLRVAVEAFKKIKRLGTRFGESTETRIATEALAQIGDVP